jgi:hypothetical protein
MALQDTVVQHPWALHIPFLSNTLYLLLNSVHPPSPSLFNATPRLPSGLVKVVEAAAKAHQLVVVSDETDGTPYRHDSLHAATTDAEADFAAAATRDATSLVQVELKPKSDLVGKGIREAGFRTRFSAAVIAGGWLGAWLVAWVGLLAGWVGPAPEQSLACCIGA